MAKKENKLTTGQIIDKCIETCNYLVLPAAGVMAIWFDFDTVLYSTAFFGMIASILSFVRLFIKD